MKPKRAAFSRYGGIGDDLIAASVAPSLCRAGYATVDALTCDVQGDVFYNNPWIDRVIKVDMGSLPDGLAWQHWHRARGREYDLFVNLSHSCESLAAFHEAQTQFWWPTAARQKLVSHLNYLELVHDACGLGYDQIGKHPLFYPTDAEREQARATAKEISADGPFIVWALAGSRCDKVYPYAPMVVARLIREVGPVVLLGGKGQEKIMAEIILDHVKQENGNDRGIHIAISPDPEKQAYWYEQRGLDPKDGGNWPLRRALTMAQHASLVVTPDSGMGWGVAFESVPKIMLLSHASTDNITKHWKNTVTLHADRERVPCWPCHRLHNSAETCKPNTSNNGAACISDIPVNRVIDEAKRAISQWARIEPVGPRKGNGLADEVHQLMIPQPEAAQQEP